MNRDDLNVFKIYLKSGHDSRSDGENHVKSSRNDSLYQRKSGLVN